MADFLIDGAILTGIADAIRGKTEESGVIIPEDMATAISGISGGSGGGGATNILSGTAAPMGSDGNDGDIYLRHSSALSDAYDTFDYIESSGTQYISTGKPFSPYVKIEIEEQGLTSANSLHGVYQGGTGVQFGCISSKACVGYSYGYDIGFAYDTSIKHKFIIDAPNGTVSFDENSISKIYNGGTSSPIVLFGVNATDRQAIDKHSARVFYYKHYENGDLTMHLIPAKRKANNEIGMLDAVTGVFYENKGTGSFSAGQTKTYDSLTFKYIIMAYCKVNGSWQELIGTLIDDVNTGGSQ